MSSTNQYTTIFGDITNYCNARCKFCYNEWPDKHHNMSMDVFRKFIQMLPLVADYTGHLSCPYEPTLHPDYLDFFEKIPIELKQKCFFTTNLVKKIPDSDFHRMAKLNVHHINVSLETFDKKMYRTLTNVQKSHFYGNLKRMTKIFKKYPDAPKIRIITMILRSNCNELIYIAKKAHKQYKPEIHEFRTPSPWYKTEKTDMMRQNEVLPRDKLDSIAENLQSLGYSGLKVNTKYDDKTYKKAHDDREKGNRELQRDPSRLYVIKLDADGTGSFCGINESFDLNEISDVPAFFNQKLKEIQEYEDTAFSSLFPKVSVIIPVYNTEKYLRECLDSVINQTLREIEIICIDDGSTDGSPAILREYAEADKRIQIVTQENRGLSAARNAGIDIAIGRYIYFIDSDDMLKTEALEELYDFADRENADVVFFDSEVLYEDEEAYLYRGPTTEKSHIRRHDYSAIKNGPELFTEMMKNGEYINCVPLQFYNTELINGYDIRFTNGILHEDVFWTFQCIMQATHATHVNNSYYIRRVRTGSILLTEMGFDNFYGHLVGYMNICSFISDKTYPTDVNSQIERLLEWRRSQVNIVYTSVNDADTWLERLNAEEQDYAKDIAAPYMKQQNAYSLSHDTQEILNRYGAKRVIIQVLKERLYPRCPGGVVRLYRMLRKR